MSKNVSNGKSKKEELDETTEDLDVFLDSSHPLLKKYRDTCPGSFKHSQSLAAIVEGVSLSLGLDITQMKIAAMYHDIGKSFNPNYFTENQLEENPHDKLDPWISSQIIAKHVADTVLILINEEKFPRDILELVSKHHGTTIMKAFFQKAKSDIDDLFRYKSAHPTDIESLVLMVCDVVEAKSRALVQAGKFEDPNVVINSTIDDLLQDGQLDDVHMRLGDLKKIKETLAKELEGIYQKRVSYEKDLIPHPKKDVK